MRVIASCLSLAFAAAAAAGCTDPLPCGTTGTSSAVPGVSIALNTASCTFTSGEAGTFTYTTTVASPLSFMTSPHAGCTPTMNDPSSFTATEIKGDAARYCPTCDVPTCSEDPGEAVAIPAGTYAGQLNWPGRQWDGPSESGNAPLGAPFPAGSYVVHVVFTIPAGSIDTQLPITVQ